MTARRRLGRNELEMMYRDIPVGTAVSRQQLSRMWGVPDRTARDYVSQLRRWDNGDGFIICSSSHGKGYFRTDDPERIKAFTDEMRGRAICEFLPLKKALRILKDPRTPDLFGGDAA